MMENNNIKTKIPNFLTLCRLFLIVPFIVLMIVLRYANAMHSTKWIPIYFTNVAIFIFCMITDFLDGFLARKWKVVSTFGKIFDPIADKAITVCMLLFLASAGLTYIPLVLVIIVRDIFVDGARIWAISKNKEVSASVWGKVKTIVISLALIVLSFAIFAPTGLNILLFNIPLIIGAIIALISGVIYLNKYLK
ncbi:CDP-diacylglycerol--glycerol-3-phosphate 3-phosphatidyltransferase [Mycoplasma sp. 3341]|uniref:CDP-diacylglycerol--glycerol-3-phosphate 3-phosphatidyltransferase n=1 Tax=Mycoplasma sp. 3341 TaxID=3447506 RepID=UPI003F6607B2